MKSLFHKRKTVFALLLLLVTILLISCAPNADDPIVSPQLGTILAAREAGEVIAALPTPTPVPAQWVKNHRITEMWSGPASDRSAISFGQTSNTFCSFRVERTEDDARIYVYNPYLDGRFWIDADAVGPVVAPERRPGPKPPDQNCAEAIYGP